MYSTKLSQWQTVSALAHLVYTRHGLYNKYDERVPFGRAQNVQQHKTNRKQQYILGQINPVSQHKYGEFSFIDKLCCRTCGRHDPIYH